MGRESLKEREIIHRIASSITKPLPFIIPHTSNLRPIWLIRLGLFFYDNLGGNGSIPNGTFIYTGFKPRFVLIKNLDAVEPWILFDTKRDPFNLATTKLSPETHQTENAVTGQGDAAYNNIDIYSNGFKCKSNNGASNGADKTIMYMTFAEEPFVTSGGVPATAR